MLCDIVEIKKIENYRLWVRFEDGVNGEIDIAKIVPFKGVFAPFKDRDFFNQVTINKELGTITWSNGADIAPETIYTIIINSNTPN